MTSKYYYGIELKNLTSLTVCSDKKSIVDFMSTWVGKEWAQFQHNSNWNVSGENDDKIEFDTIAIKTEEIISVNYCSGKEKGERK